MTFLSLGVCAYNEAASIERMLGRILRSAVWSAHEGRREILVCANGCTDDTHGKVERLREHTPEIRLIPLREKSKNLAWRRIVAESDPRAEILIFADADVLVHPLAIQRLSVALERDPSCQVAGGRIVPSAAYVPRRNRYQDDVVALTRLMRDMRARTLDGKLYAIRREAALEVDLPTDGRIADDYYLQIVFRGRTAIVGDAIAIGRFPEKRELKHFMLRHEVSKCLLRESGSIDRFLRERHQRQRVGALMLLPWAVVRLGPVRFVRVLWTVCRLRSDATRRARAVMLSGQDSWRPLGTSKLAQEQTVPRRLT